MLDFLTRPIKTKNFLFPPAAMIVPGIFALGFLSAMMVVGMDLAKAIAPFMMASMLALVVGLVFSLARKE